MSMWRNGASRLSLLIGLGFFSTPAFPANFNVTTGSTDTAAKTLTGTETGTVQSGATLSVTATAITWAGPSAVPGVTIDNFGRIQSGNRAIDTTNSNTPRNLTLNNHLGAVISSFDDTFRLNAAIGNGTVVVNNDGKLSSDTGQVFDFAANTSATGRVQINNSATGVITAAAADAVRTGLGTVVINNSGLIDSTASANRAINLNTGNLNSIVSFQVFNNTGGIIQSQDDAVRITGSSGLTTTTGSFLLDNAGTIQTLGAGSGQAIDWRDLNSPAATVRIINRATGIISTADTDAIRPAGNSVIENYGQIIAGGMTLGSSIGGVRFSGDAIDFGANSGTVYNYAGGLISGAKSGTASDAGGNIIVYNDAGATILGRNGAGVGSGSNATVYNYGTITGAIDSVSTRSDGDGIDADFRADVVNYGLIQGTGARGGDANGRLNNSEGIAFGGGTVANYGTISGANAGIVANNDSNLDNSRSGVAATTITNYASGMIVGQTSYAIRLENKTGTAADNDTIVNYGTIIGNGAIPDPNATVLLNTGAVDTGSVGTLNGVTYTGTGAARFIRGDGSAIQMGEGADVLTNYGVIIGNNGRAVNLEGGNDVANIMPGSRISGLVDGGAGNDTLNYNKIGLTEAKRAALQAGQTVNIGGTLYTSFETVNGAAQSFSSFATTGSARGVASIFDNGSTTTGASLGMLALIDTVASSSDVGAALSQLSPAAYQGLSTFTVSSAQQSFSQVGQQMTDTRLNGSRVDFSGASAALAMINEGFFSKRSGGSVPSSELPFAGFGDVGMPANAMAYGGDMARKALPNAVPLADPDRGLFFSSGLSFLHQGARAGAPASRATTASLVAGTDWHVSDRSIVGVFGSFAHTSGDLDTLGSSTRINTGAVGMYGMYNAPGWFATGMALHGWSDYDNTRIALGTANTSSFDGTHYAFRGSVGSDRRVGQWLVTPEVALQYVRVMLPGFAETGGAALVVGKDNSESLRSSVGARFAYDLRLVQGTVTPELRVAWQHEFQNGVRNLTASFTDPGFGGTFATPTGAQVRDLGVFGVGVSGRLGPLSTVSLNYDALIGDHDTVSHNITGRLRHSF